jgi:hypothetical protein
VHTFTNGGGEGEYSFRAKDLQRLETYADWKGNLSRPGPEPEAQHPTTLVEEENVTSEQESGQTDAKAQPTAAEHGDVAEPEANMPPVASAEGTVGIDTDCDGPTETGLTDQNTVPNGEYLPEPPDPKTVSCNGFSCNRYDQMSIDDGVEMLRAMGAVALQLNDDLRAKNAAKEEAEAKLGVHLALKLLPGLEYYRHIYKQHNGERDFRLAECKGIEELVKKLGISPATVRTWRQRYRHLPEYRAALEANGIPIEERPERIRKCDSCGTRINLPEGQEPDHDENCPEHPMRREAMAVVRDLAIRGETYKRIACGEGKYAMLPEKSRIQKIQELAQGTPVSDVVELDDFSVLLNRIRGQEMDEMLSVVNGYYAHQRERLSIIGIELVVRCDAERAAEVRNATLDSTEREPEEKLGLKPDETAVNSEQKSGVNGSAESGATT